MIFWLRYGKIQLKTAWKSFLENRYKWKVPFLLIIRKFSIWTQKESQRTVSGVTFSIIIHSSAILLFLGMEQLTQPVDTPIREISFLDLTEEPIKIKPKKNRVQKSVRNQLILENNKNLALNTTIHKKNDLNILGKDKLFLDIERNQAPIKFEQIEPVSQNLLNPTDVINISHAKGLRNDEKIKRPIPINLNKNKSLMLGSNFKPTKINKNDGRTISLNNKVLKNQSSLNPIKLNTIPPEINLNKTEMGSRQTQTFITGPIANRKILKKIIPPFPQWAKRVGVGATISLKFTVMENGNVKENVIVERTSGSSEWDQLVLQSLKNWQFIALPKSGTRNDQTGVITFQFII